MTMTVLLFSSIDVVKVKSYANRLFDLACVATKIKINKPYFFP